MGRRMGIHSEVQFNCRRERKMSETESAFLEFMIEKLLELKMKVWKEGEVQMFPLPKGVNLPVHACPPHPKGFGAPSLAYKSDLEPRCGRCLKPLRF